MSKILIDKSNHGCLCKEKCISAGEVWECKGLPSVLAEQPAQQEPVQYKCMVIDNHHRNPIPFEQWVKPAQQAVPDAIHHTDLGETLEYIQGWNDCRQLMMEMIRKEIK